jgi:phage tail-like protein
MKLYPRLLFVLFVLIMIPSISADTPDQRQNEYPVQFNILVEIDGIVSATFESVEGLESKTSIIEYKDATWSKSPRKIPGFTTYSNIILRRSYTFANKLWQWRQMIVDGNLERKNGAIIITGRDRQEMVRFVFKNAWPVRWKLSTHDDNGNRRLVEEIELAIEGLEQRRTRR